MGLVDLFRPRWRHSNPRVREQAVRRLSDGALLAKIVVSDSSPTVQRSACERIHDPTLLQEIVAHPYVDHDVGLDALRRLSDQAHLLAVASTASISGALRVVAIQRLGQSGHAEGLSGLTALIAHDDEVGAAALRAAHALDRDVARLWRPFSLGKPESPLHRAASSIIGELSRRTMRSDAPETLARLASESADALASEPARAAVLATALNRIEQPTPTQQELYRRVEDFKEMHRAAPIGAGYALVGDADIYDAAELAALHDAQRAYWECESGTQTTQLAADLQALQERLDEKYRGVREAREREARAQRQALAEEKRRAEATQLLSKLEEAPDASSVDPWLPSTLVLLLSVRELSSTLATAARARLTRRPRK